MHETISWYRRKAFSTHTSIFYFVLTQMMINGWISFTAETFFILIDNLLLIHSEMEDTSISLIYWRVSIKFNSRNWRCDNGANGGGNSPGSLFICKRRIGKIKFCLGWIYALIFAIKTIFIPRIDIPINQDAKWSVWNARWLIHESFITETHLHS